MSTQGIKPTTNFKNIKFSLNIVLSGCAIGFFTWDFISYVKFLLQDHYRLNLNAWTDIYYHPQDASLPNYVVLCIIMAIYGLILYVGVQKNNLISVRKKSSTLAMRHPILLIISAVLLFIMPNQQLEIYLRLLVSLCLLIVIILPLRHNTHRRLVIIPLNWLRALCKSLQERFFCLHNTECFKDRMLLLFAFALLCAISIEPVKLITGPIYIMNEYKNIYSDTKIKGDYVNNKTFLDTVGEKTNSIELSNFIGSNALEYNHQNMSWGPFNHIGHILNPLNEYICGKDPADVYMQYGQGNTLLYKWTMGLVGSMSLENYYSCYVYYIIYSLAFLLLLLYLFRDKFYVVIAFLVYSIAYYAQDYLAFVHAPGFIPTIHLFDTSVLLLLLLYFRRTNPVYLLSALFLAMFSIYMNRQFGLILLISTCAAGLMYLWENKQGMQRYIPMTVLLFLPCFIIAAPFFKTTVNSSNPFYYFLRGYLSWRPEPFLVFLTILYLGLSYYFLFLIRKQTHHLKYAFIFTFIYSQGLLTYYYWNGHINHMMPLLPFIGLELVLMLYLCKELLIIRKKAHIVFTAAMFLGTTVLVFSCAKAAKNYYHIKQVFVRNFKQHKTYNWDFERAKVVSTINPEPFRESVALIQKYSPQENSGIYLVSVYDNVLPFLAKRYSMMPFFEMQWFVFSPKERTETISRLKIKNPEYLLVDNNIKYECLDIWAPYFESPADIAYRKSHQDKRLELGKIFAAVEKNFEKIDEGILLSVYKRKSQAVSLSFSKEQGLQGEVGRVD